MPIAPLFLSHGSPMTALEPGTTGPFWQQLGTAIAATAQKPRAILALSASDAVLYRRAWPLALPPLLTGFAAILVLLARA